ncbi:MAG: T9SS type A sorting domain-containing protein [Bacteroidetes bacterium]|nr:MAG: T9SS type A sorting domain-containing protein [Bacteroidota bacterium]
MKTIALTLSLLVASYASAQITITKATMPAANDTFNYVNIGPVKMNQQIQKQGGNQQWQFGLSDSLTSSEAVYKSSLKTPYAFYFFNTVGLLLSESAGMGQFSVQDMYQFYSTTNSAYKAEGIGFKISITPAPLAGFYQDEDEIFNFPLTYGRRDSTTFQVSINIPLIGSYKQSGYRISEVVGWGEAVLVTDTFDCLLVRSYVNSADSIFSQLVNYGFPTERVEYKWLSNAHKGVLVESTGTEVAGQFVPTLSRFHYFAPKQANNGGGGNGGNTGIQTAESAGWLIYPNPTRGEVFFNKTAAKAELYAMDGKVMTTEVNTTSLNLSVAGGVYMLHLTDENGVRSIQKLVVR